MLRCHAQENRVTKMENLAALVHLKKLDLGKNKIQKIEGLETLSSLVQLSLEDNEIESLAGLSRVSTLLELYLGNNKMGDMREVLQVKSRVKISMENMREWRLTLARLCNGCCCNGAAAFAPQAHHLGSLWQPCVHPPRVPPLHNFPPEKAQGVRRPWGREQRAGRGE